LNTGWNDTLSMLSQRGEACALVTIFSAQGSTPRAIGSKMLVSMAKSYYSIGGGHLEHQAIKRARTMLGDKSTQAYIQRFSLGASLGQCCGGQIELLFEAFYPHQQAVVIFGAGHIAKALVTLLAELPCTVKWIDSRREQFPNNLPRNTEKIILDEVILGIDQIADNSYILIMTHNHQLDQQLCEALLKQNRHCFIGLIGSATKLKKFRLRLSNKGFSSAQINSICCPIGITKNKGKLPIEIAISVSAQLIEFYRGQKSEKALGTDNVAQNDLSTIHFDQSNPASTLKNYSEEN